MTKAEFLIARGLRDVPLPSGITVKIRRPRTLELFRAGLFPLSVSQIDKDKVDPDEYEQMLKEADRAAARLICECTVEPKVVSRRAKPGEVPIEALEPDDFATLAEGIIAFAVEEKVEPPAEPHSNYESYMQMLAGACKTFGIDPTEAVLWEPERTEQLIEFAKLTIPKRD